MNCSQQSCDQGAKCVKIKCPLQGMDSNAVITLHSRLWNSTFIEVTELKRIKTRNNLFPKTRIWN